MKNIKEIEGEFEEKFVEFQPDGSKGWGAGLYFNKLVNYQEIEQFLSTSLTSLLEGLKEGVINLPEGSDSEEYKDREQFRQEVIKIIDSFKNDSLDKPKNYYTHTCGIVGCNGNKCI